MNARETLLEGEDRQRAERLAPERPRGVAHLDHRARERLLLDRLLQHPMPRFL